jgi:PilZ domain
MANDRRRDDRVAFERGFPAAISSLDGKWRMPCAMDDVSSEGARLTVKGNVEGVDLKKFILLLSANGKAFRRCELSWIEGSELGVRFIKADGKKRAPAKAIKTAEEAAPETADAGPVIEV